MVGRIGRGLLVLLGVSKTDSEKESAYLAAIQSAATYKIADGTLTIANAKGKAVLTYRAETPVSLTSGTWVMTGYNNGKQAVVTALPDVEVTAIFGAGAGPAMIKSLVSAAS